MPSTTRTEKATLRREIREKLSALSPAARQESDRLLTLQFLARPETERAFTVLLFCGVKTEPDTCPLIQALLDRGKAVALPVCLPGRAMEARQIHSLSDLAAGHFGIPEPSRACPLRARDEIDLVLVPGLCYDRAGFRLGQGGGYYDRFLPGFQGMTVGLCRALVLQERVPREGHDFPVQLVLTESEGLSSLCPDTGQSPKAPPVPGGYRS